MKPLRVGLIGYDGVQALDIIGPSDAFTIADIETDNGQRRPCYEVIIVGITNKPFRAESGVSFQPHTTLRNAPTLDTLIIPGGRGARIGQSSSLIAKWILSRAERIRRLASGCAGGHALAPTRLLHGRSGATHARRSLTRCAGQTRLSFAAPLRQAIQTGLRRDAGRVRRKFASGRSAPPIERAHANNRERREFCRVSKRRCFPARVSASVRRKAQ